MKSQQETQQLLFSMSKSKSLLTSKLIAAPPYLTEDAHVAHGDHQQRHEVHRAQTEHVVSDLEPDAGERVEGHALLEAHDVRVMHHSENDALEIKSLVIFCF